jgi:PhzF family phenazine biosynthesis protein
MPNAGYCPRGLNNSETAFLIKPDEDDCDGIIRYFTPNTEVPVCGHATIAALYALAHEYKLSSCIMRIKTKVGVLPVEIIKTTTEYEIVMTQGKFELGPVFDAPKTQKLLEALGLSQDETDPRCPVQIASTGHSKVMVGIKSRAKLNRLTPDFHALVKLSKQIGCNGYFVFTFDTTTLKFNLWANVCPAIGINEDP